MKKGAVWMSLDKVRYDAFISYRHCKLDSFISENLHKKLESYKIPKSVVKKIGHDGKTQIERVFRDEAELPLSSNLSDPISEALDNSEFLIVICTPRLSQSQWCKKEIETFVETHDRKHVLLVLAEGEPEESFPEILMYEEVKTKDENGNEVTVRVDREPLAADCRGDNNKQRLKALDNVVLKLCAAIFGLNYDDLKQRHRERQIRRRLIAMSAALAIVTVFAITCLSFMIKISRQNKVISDKYAGAMASASEDLLSQGLRLDSIYAVRSVLPDKEEKGYNPDAYKALVKSLAPYETENCYFPAENFKLPLGANDFSISNDRSYALVNCSGYFSIIDIGSGTELRRVDSEYSIFAVLNDTGVVYINNDLQAVYLEPHTGDETVLSDDAYDLKFVPGEDVTLVFTGEGIKGYKELSEALYIDLAGNGDGELDYSLTDSYVSDDGKYAAFVLDGYDSSRILYIDIAEGKLKKSIVSEADGSVAVACDGNRLYVYHEEDDEYMGGTGSSVLEATDISTGEVTSCDVPGSGFFDMKINDDGIFIVSDRLAYLLDFDLAIKETVTGYMDAVCVFARDKGYVILDERGHMYSYHALSGFDKTYTLYGHDDSDLIHSAIYVDDEFYVNYSDSGRVVKYSPVPVSYEAMNDIGDAKMLEDSNVNGADLGRLEGIDGISVFGSAISDDGKYVAVNSDDGVLYIFGAASGKRVREVNNTGITILNGVFVYLKAAGVYVIENGVFDKDFNMISVLTKGRIAAIGNDDKSLVIGSPYSEDTFYKITLLSYDEVISRADVILGGYKPDQGIRDKYSME